MTGEGCALRSTPYTPHYISTRYQRYSHTPRISSPQSYTADIIDTHSIPPQTSSPLSHIPQTSATLCVSRCPGLQRYRLPDGITILYTYTQGHHTLSIYPRHHRHCVSLCLGLQRYRLPDGFFTDRRLEYQKNHYICIKTQIICLT